MQPVSVSSALFILSLLRIEQHVVSFMTRNKCSRLLESSSSSRPRVSAEQSAETTPSSPSSCFEIIDGHLIKGTAGGLEHDVSMEECQCFCATSRYDNDCLDEFICISARLVDIHFNVNRRAIITRNAIVYSILTIATVVPISMYRIVKSCTMSVTLE